MSESGRSGVTTEAADLLSVTMSPSAAETALIALDFASARIAVSLLDHPRDERDQRAWDAREWLDWLAGRIRGAQMKADR